MATKKHSGGGDAYQTRLDKVKKKYEETAGDTRWWKPRNPKSYVRILPPWGPSAEGVFYYSAALHYGFNIGGRDAAIPCSSSVSPPRGDCKVCEFVSLLKGTGDDDHATLAKRLRFRRKYWVNLVTSNKESQHSKEAFMFGGNKKFIDKVIAAMENDDYGNVTDPDEGRDLVIGKEGEGMATRYDYTFRAKATPLTTVNWKKKMYALDQEVIEWMSDQEISDAIKRQFGDSAKEVGLSLVSKKKKPIKKEEDKDEEEEDDEETTEEKDESEEDEDEVEKDDEEDE